MGNNNSGHDPYAALRYRDYRCLLGAGILATIGAEIQALAVGWYLYERTNSATALGCTGLALFLPVLLLSLPAGHAVDRFNRKRVYQFALGVTVLGSLGLALLAYAEGPLPLVYLCLVFTGCGRALSSPARASLLPQLIPSSLLGNAITWNSSGWQVANVTGPAIGGLAYALAGEAAPIFLLACCCPLLGAVLLLPIRPQAGPSVREPPSFQALLAGVRFVRHNQLLLAAITLDLFAVLLGGATALLPIFAKDILEVGPTGLGCLRAAPALGAFLMAMVLAHRPVLNRTGPMLLLAVSGFGAATIGFGLSVDPVLSLVLLALAGAMDNISVVVRHTLMQVLTPDSMRGRVAAVNLVFISSSNELGAFESGMTAAWFGPVISVVGGGIGTILVVILVMLRWPQLLHLATMHGVSKEELAREEPEKSPAGP